MSEQGAGGIIPYVSPTRFIPAFPWSYVVVEVLDLSTTLGRR